VGFPIFTSFARSNPKGTVMQVPEPTDAPVNHTEPKVTHTQNAVELWSRESGANAPTPALTVIRLDGNPQPLVLFTASIRRVTLHFVDDPAMREFVRCNAPDCVLCRVNRRQDVRDLLPVFDHVKGQLALLPVSPNMRPGALRPLLTEPLRRVQNGERLVVHVRRGDNTMHEVAVAPVSPKVAERAATAIADFDRRMQAGVVDLAAAYSTLSNDTLAKLETIRLLQEAGSVA
jgi:hypothetical protein